MNGFFRVQRLPVLRQTEASECALVCLAMVLDFHGHRIDLTTLRFLDQLLDVLRVAQETGADPVDAARAFYHVSGLLDVPWILSAIFHSAHGQPGDR